MARQCVSGFASRVPMLVDLDAPEKFFRSLSDTKESRITMKRTLIAKPWHRAWARLAAEFESLYAALAADWLGELSVKAHRVEGKHS